MRTKLLLTAAIVAAGIATSMAQVYSVNVVGYVNTVCEPGFNLVCNPLNGTDNTLNTIIPAPPAGTAIFRWDAAAQDFQGVAPTWGGPGVGWDPNLAINPGEGVFLYCEQKFTNTFVGEVQQGTTNLTIPCAFAMIGSIPPVGGAISDVLKDLVPCTGDAVFLWDNSPTQDFGAISTYGGPGVGWDPAITIKVGEAMFYFHDCSGPPPCDGTITWTRVFNVQ